MFDTLLCCNQYIGFPERVIRKADSRRGPPNLWSIRVVNIEQKIVKTIEGTAVVQVGQMKTFPEDERDKSQYIKTGHRGIIEKLIIT